MKEMRTLCTTVILLGIIFRWYSIIWNCCVAFAITYFIWIVIAYAVCSLGSWIDKYKRQSNLSSGF